MGHIMIHYSMNGLQNAQLSVLRSDFFEREVVHKLTFWSGPNERVPRETRQFDQPDVACFLTFFRVNT